MTLDAATSLTNARIAALGGPTASGKTALAVALRQRGLPIEILNFDALQVYRGLDAGTAKPSPAERQLAPCHLLDLVEPTEPMTAGRWAELARQEVARVADRGAWPLLVGGTGLYLRALLRGLAPIPPTPPELRARLEAEWQVRGGPDMHRALAAVDPRYASHTPAANRQRVLRALEVFQATGKPFSQWHEEHAQQPPTLACHLTVLVPGQAALQARLQARAAGMALPLLAEVRALLAAGLDPRAPGMQALGYRDAAQVLLAQADATGFADRLALGHRQYARRQATWFASEDAQLRLDPDEPHGADVLAAALQVWFTGS